MQLIDKNKEEKAKELLEDVRSFLKSGADLTKRKKLPNLVQPGGAVSVSSRSPESSQDIYRFKQPVFNLEKVKEGLKSSNIPFFSDELAIKVSQDTKIQEDSFVLYGNEFKSAIFQVLAESLITPDKIDDSLLEDTLDKKEDKAEKGGPDAQE